MVPAYLKSWLLVSFLNMSELRLFLRERNGKFELVKLAGNDYSLPDTQRDTYLEELKKEENMYNGSEIKKSPKVNSYTSSEEIRNSEELYLEELKREENKYDKSKTENNIKNISEAQTQDKDKRPRPLRPTPTRPSTTASIPSRPRPTRPRPTRPRPTRPRPTRPRPTRPKPTRPRPTRPRPTRPRPTSPRPTRPRPTRPSTTRAAPTPSPGIDNKEGCGDLIEINVNIKDDNLQSQSGILDPKACAAFCKTNPGCNYWTWKGIPGITFTGMCHLKTSSSGKQTVQETVYSGQRPC